MFLWMMLEIVGLGEIKIAAFVNSIIFICFQGCWAVSCTTVDIFVQLLVGLLYIIYRWESQKIKYFLFEKYLI